MKKLIDLTNKKFGRLTVIKQAPTTRKRTWWICKCDCGNVVTVRSDSLRSGNTTSCGCYQREVVSKYQKNRIRTKE